MCLWGHTEPALLLVQMEGWSWVVLASEHAQNLHIMGAATLLCKTCSTPARTGSLFSPLFERLVVFFSPTPKALEIVQLLIMHIQKALFRSCMRQRQAVGTGYSAQLPSSTFTTVKLNIQQCCEPCS